MLHRKTHLIGGRISRKIIKKFERTLLIFKWSSCVFTQNDRKIQEAFPMAIKLDYYYSNMTFYILHNVAKGFTYHFETDCQPNNNVSFCAISSLSMLFNLWSYQSNICSILFYIVEKYGWLDASLHKSFWALVPGK